MPDLCTRRQRNGLQCPNPAKADGLCGVHGGTDYRRSDTKREARDNVTIRLSPDGIAAVDKMAEQEDRTRSQMIRILIAEAVKARAKR